MSDEPKHPTYGTLDQLLAAIKHDIEQGYELRIGLLGAIHWFSDQYGQRRTSDNTGEGR